MQNCPNCQSINSKIYNFVKGWTLKKCLNCNILFTVLNNKRVISSTNINIYSNDYVKNYQFKANKLKIRFKGLLTKIESYKSGGNILDIGCSLGYFLQVVENSSNNWITEGVETNKKLIELARKNINGKIWLGMLPKLPVKTNHYQVITCFDVLEHSFELNKNINEINRVLKKDGILVIQTPNYQSLMAYLCRQNWDWWSPPDHLLHFSFSFMTDYLKKNNFEILEAYTYEPVKDFFTNIKGTLGKTIFEKLSYLLFLPLLLVGERIAWKINYGALIFVIARKK